MKKSKSMVWLFVVASALGILILGSPLPATAQTDKNQAEKNQEKDDDDKDEKLTRNDKKRVKITMEAARATALNRVNGTITEEDLENEKGRLQYAFDIRDRDGKVWDVEIDAITGEVLKADDGSVDEDDEDEDKAETVSPADAKAVKISMDAARAIALKRVSGTVVEEELEKEEGRLQYSFDIRDSNGKIWDVEVDAKTGKILKATDEDDEDDNNEQGNLRKAKRSVVYAASAVKRATVKTVGKIF